MKPKSNPKRRSPDRLFFNWLSSIGSMILFGWRAYVFILFPSLIGALIVLVVFLLSILFTKVIFPYDGPVYWYNP